MKARPTHFILAAGLLFCILAPQVQGQGETETPGAGVEEEIMDWPTILPESRWYRPGELAPIGTRAEMVVPEGFFMGNKSTSDLVLRETGNIPSSDIAVLVPAGQPDWMVFFDFDEVGYVEDDEEIDADAWLKAMKDTDGPSNEARRLQGLDPLTTKGWSVPPQYNSESQNLEWGLILGSSYGDSINYFSKILGRRGVMTVNLVCSPEQFDEVLPQFRAAMKSFAYTTGNRYDEYREGDKVAEYGLAGLAGLVGVGIAAKTGILAKFLAKFWQFILAGFVGIGVLIKKLLPGKRRQSREGAPGAQPLPGESDGRVRRPPSQ